MSIFKDKTAVVTGAASGIGKALAEELARRGAKVVATDINEEALQSTVASIKGASHPVHAQKQDVTDYEAFKQLVDDTVAREGRLDYIFNNAGIAIVGEVRDATIDHWRKVLDVNLHGVVYGSVLAYQQMVKQGSGHIVNLASVEGLMPFPTTVSYVTSKFGVMGLSEGMWVEGKDLGVRVSAVCPGFVSTPIFDVSDSVGFEKQTWREEALTPWERFAISPEGCAQVILKGVEKNKPIITVTVMAKIMWWLTRISPTLVMNKARKDFNKWRDKGRSAA
jgi:NAD(P)-dependent dehydrogenase (short-subunit alcohol dehydrogenase family)